MMSQSGGMLRCVGDNSSFPIVPVFLHLLFYSITQFLEGKNSKNKIKLNEKA